MEEEKSSGEILDEIAARFAAADLVRDEIRRLERVIVELEEGAAYRANVGLGREFGEQAIAHCRTNHDSAGVRVVSERFLADLDGPMAGRDKGDSARETTTASPSKSTDARSPETDHASETPIPSPVPSAARRTSVKSPPAPVAPNTFFGIKVPEKQLNRVDEILADARAKAEMGAIATEDTYERCTGKNIWRKYLFHAAHESYRAELGSSDVEGDVDTEPEPNLPPPPSSSHTSVDKEAPSTMQTSPTTTSTDGESSIPSDTSETDVEFGPGSEGDGVVTEADDPVEELPEEELPAFLFEETSEAPRKASWDDPYANGGASSRMTPTEGPSSRNGGAERPEETTSRPKVIPPPKGVPRRPGVRNGLGMNVEYIEDGKDPPLLPSSGESR